MFWVFVVVGGGGGVAWRVSVEGRVALPERRGEELSFACDSESAHLRHVWTSSVSTVFVARLMSFPLRTEKKGSHCRKQAG